MSTMPSVFELSSRVKTKYLTLSFYFQYISHLMDWIEGQINDEAIFPVKNDVPFPKTFVSVNKKILTRLYRVFVHVYVHHFDRLMEIGKKAFSSPQK